MFRCKDFKKITRSHIPVYKDMTIYYDDVFLTTGNGYRYGTEILSFNTFISTVFHIFFFTDRLLLVHNIRQKITSILTIHTR